MDSYCIHLKSWSNLIKFLVHLDLKPANISIAVKVLVTQHPSNSRPSSDFSTPSSHGRNTCRYHLEWLDRIRRFSFCKRTKNFP